MTDPETLEALYQTRTVLKPTYKAYLRHLLLLAVTFCTVTIAGTLFPFGREPNDVLPAADPQTVPDVVAMILALPMHYGELLRDAVQGQHPEQRS